MKTPAKKRATKVPTDGPCLDCGRSDVTFQVSSDLWERATGLAPNGGVICPRCFEQRAILRGLKLSNWTVHAITEEVKK